MSGTRYFERGAFAEANGKLMRACRIIEERTLGKLAQSPSETDEALASQSRAREVASRNGEYLQMRYLIARALWHTGPTGHSMEAVRLALDLVEAAGGSTDPRLRTLQGCLGLLLQGTGRHSEAEGMFRDCLAACEADPDVGGLDLSVAQHHVACAEARAGRFKRALELLGSALANRRRELGGDNPAFIPLFLFRAKLLLTVQDWPMLASTLFDLLKLAEIARARIGVGSERQLWLGIPHGLGPTIFSLAMRCAQDDVEFTVCGLNALVHYIAPVSSEIHAIFQRARASTLDEVRLAHAEWRDIATRQTLIGLAGNENAWSSLRRLSVAGGNEIARIFQQLEDRKEDLEVEISRRLRRHGLPPRAASYAQTLAEGSALLVLGLADPVVDFDFEFSSSAPTKRYEWISPAKHKPGHRVYAIVASKHGVAKAHELGIAHEIVDVHHAALDAVCHGAPEVVHQSLSMLYELAFEPLEDDLRSFRHIEILTEDPLAALPFSCLVDRTGHYLVERFAFSRRDFLPVAPENHRESAPPMPAAVLAAPDFTSAGAREYPSWTSLGLDPPQAAAPLTFAEEEGRHVARLVGGTLAQGSEATRNWLLSLRSPIVLHIATHGQLAPGRDDLVKSFDPISGTMEGSPMLRSRLLLAGADETPLGVVSGLEIAGMHLDGTKLVALTACESGRGDADRGEGALGLARAFLLAGADAVVSALGPLPDRSAMDFAVHLYGSLKRGRTRAEALRDAQLAMLSNPETASVRHWGLYQLTGEGTSPVWSTSGR
ncbi:MAG TPA: CHAT domain-containing protein [Polyangiaceae bacterium]|nr:CHAT domain-containing protein [Polyangiaceae bacterium]